jgi:hypothetical protein
MMEIGYGMIVYKASVMIVEIRIWRNGGKVYIRLNCAQIVPVKVKYFQTFPNETKNTGRITHRFNMLKIHEI